MARSVLVIGLAAFFGIGAFEPSRVPAPTFSYQTFGGCEDVWLYAWNPANTEAMLVRADRKVLGLDVGTTTLSLADTRKGLEVRVELFDEPQRAIEYCTDVGIQRPGKPTATLRAFSGEVIITVGQRGVVNDPKPFNSTLPYMYQATVVLRDVAFKHPDGTVFTMKGPITLSAAVGYYWG